MKLCTKLYSYLTNIYGWHTNRKIVVIESDDWGSVRMPSINVYELALKQGYRVDLNEYEKYDSLLSNNDLINLFKVLESFKDINNQHPIITANCVVANPNFDQILKSDFQEYHCESIIDTFKKYPNHQNVWELWQYGLKNNLLKFQYHAYEHVNVSLFLDKMKMNDIDLKWAINHGMVGIFKKGGNKRLNNPYVEATRFLSEKDKNEKMERYLSGLNEFFKLFGYKSSTIVPTNFLWDNQYNDRLIDYGIKGIQGSYIHTDPLTNVRYRRITSMHRKKDLVDLVRNVSFEPTISNNNKIIDQTIKSISIAFLYNKPAIISMHRINFCGNIFEKNRDDNLFFLSELLNKIIKKWPDIEFISSDNLCNLILSNDCNSQ